MENWRKYLTELSFHDPDPMNPFESPKRLKQLLRSVIELLDPTGISAWPDIPPAIEAYEKNPSVLNAADLTLALASAIPAYGKLSKAFKKSK